MDLFEYQGKQYFARYGISVSPEFLWARWMLATMARHPTRAVYDKCVHYATGTDD